MLKITRRVGEKLIIGDDVVITILGRHGMQTKLGITAPKELPVHREEIYKKIKEQNNKQVVNK